MVSPDPADTKEDVAGVTRLLLLNQMGRQWLIRYLVHGLRMQKNSDSDPISLPYAASYSTSASYRAHAATADSSNLQSLLTFLVYHAHGLRMGLELSICVFAYTFVNLLVPWERLGVPLKWSTLISWFGCSFAVILFDQLVLCRSVHTFRKAYLLGLAGAYEKALHYLEKIGPQSQAFVRLPLALYHFHRAEIFTQSEDFLRAESELQLAELIDPRSEQLRIRRSRFQRAKGDFTAARAELELAQRHFGELPVLLLEQAVLELDERKDLWLAKRQLKRVLTLPDCAHFAGESIHVLAQAYLSVCMLSTGEAEEGLEKLTNAIERLRGAVIYVDSLRPILARLLLERSLYYATHREPTSAVIDLKLGASLCSYAQHCQLAEQAKLELLDRHSIRVF